MATSGFPYWTFHIHQKERFGLYMNPLKNDNYTLMTCFMCQSITLSVVHLHRCNIKTVRKKTKSSTKYSRKQQKVLIKSIFGFCWYLFLVRKTFFLFHFKHIGTFFLQVKNVWHWTFHWKLPQNVLWKWFLTCLHVHILSFHLPAKKGLFLWICSFATLSTVLWFIATQLVPLTFHLLSCWITFSVPM